MKKADIPAEMMANISDVINILELLVLLVQNILQDNFKHFHHHFRS